MFNVELLTAKNLPKVITGCVTSRIIFCIEGKNSRFLIYYFIFIGSTPILTSKAMSYQVILLLLQLELFSWTYTWWGKSLTVQECCCKSNGTFVLAITNKPIIGMKLYLLTHHWCPVIALFCCDNQNSIVSIILLMEYTYCN